MNRSLFFACLVAPSVLAAAAHARQDQTNFDATAAAATAADPDSHFTGPIFDQPGDGAIWVHGRSFKAKFDRQGFEYIPFLGSDAPQDYPIDFTIESARVGSTELGWQADVEPELDRETVTFHRGAFDEVYVVGADSIEQNFVVRERRTSGDLHVVVHAASELERADSSLGVAFGNELGGVQFGKASIRDASGRAVHSLTRLAGESIEIQVPQKDLESASFPLAIDPLVSTWTVTVIAAPTSNFPDTSYDWWTNSWLCVNQETFSATDHDIIARQFTPGGTLLNQTYVDASSTDWTRPRVANHKAQHVFMVVAEVAATTANGGSIQARTYSATARSMTNSFVVAIGAPGYNYWCPDIGGDTNPAGTRPFCIVYLQSWNELGGGAYGDPFIADYALYSPSGALIRRSLLGEAVSEPVRLSKSNGTPTTDAQRWVAVWPWNVESNPPQTQEVLNFIEIDSSGNTSTYIQWDWPLWDGPPAYNNFSVTSRFDGTGNRQFAVGLVGSGSPANPTPHAYLFTTWVTDSGLLIGGGSSIDLGPGPYSGLSAETDGTNLYCVATRLIQAPHGLSHNNLYLSSYHVQQYAQPTTLQSNVLIAGSTDDESMPSLASMHSSGGGSSNMLCVYKRVATLGGGASILAATLY